VFDYLDQAGTKQQKLFQMADKFICVVAGSSKIDNIETCSEQFDSCLRNDGKAMRRRCFWTDC
jgi:hypothetical protein